MEDSTTNYPSVKLVLVGEAGTGKTCIFTRLCKGKFDSETTSSIGALGESITLTCSNNDKLKFNIWDTAGQEIYHSVNKIFYTDAEIVLIVYDVTVPKSFETIKSYWYNEVSNTCVDTANLVESETVDEEEVVAFAQEKGVKCKRVSALTGDNIDDLFKELADEYIKKVGTSKNGKKVGLTENQVKKSKKIC